MGMTAEEIRADFTSLEEELSKYAQSRRAQRVAEYCKGNSVHYVAEALGKERGWVRNMLDLFAIESSIGGGQAPAPLRKGVGGGAPSKAGPQEIVMREYAPEEPSDECVEEFKLQGYTDDVAKRMARASEAAEAAIEAGAIKESFDKQKRRVAELVLPNGADFRMRLQRACSDVRAAARLLNEAKMSDLKRAFTRELVADAHAEWAYQMERMENIHPNFLEDVEKCAND